MMYAIIHWDTINVKAIYDIAEVVLFGDFSPINYPYFWPFPHAETKVFFMRSTIVSTLSYYQIKLI